MAAARRASPKKAGMPHPTRAGEPRPQDVDEYLARLDADQARALATVRKRIHAAHPGLTEAISYGVPVFRLGGKGLVSLGAAKDHCSLYIMSPRFVAKNKQLLAAHDLHGVTVRFPADRPLPADFVKAVVMGRAQESA
jgi:uncharacterized protein YdhG (YjbR/CyaY superfamily)